MYFTFLLNNHQKVKMVFGRLDFPQMEFLKPGGSLHNHLNGYLLRPPILKIDPNGYLTNLQGPKNHKSLTIMLIYTTYGDRQSPCL